MIDLSTLTESDIRKYQEELKKELEYREDKAFQEKHSKNLEKALQYIKNNKFHNKEIKKNFTVVLGLNPEVGEYEYGVLFRPIVKSCTLDIPEEDIGCYIEDFELFHELYLLLDCNLSGKDLLSEYKKIVKFIETYIDVELTVDVEVTLDPGSDKLTYKVNLSSNKLSTYKIRQLNLKKQIMDLLNEICDPSEYIFNGEICSLDDYIVSVLERFNLPEEFYEDLFHKVNS